MTNNRSNLPNKTIDQLISIIDHLRTAERLYGPVAYRHVVLAKNKEKDMLGTAHHSIFREPGTDNCYIAYHRFVTPLTRFAEGKGYHREVCITPLSFGPDGLMRRVRL